MALEAVLLDVGGTLLTEEPARADIYARAAAARGLEVTGEGMRRLMARAHEELPCDVVGSFRYSDPWFEAFMERVFCADLGLDPAELPALSRELFGLFSDPGTFRLYPGARELLGELRGLGLAVGVVSNWSGRLQRLLERLEVAPALDVVVSSADVGVEKPDPRIFHLALERLGVEPGRAVHAGNDLEKDALGARRAGLEGILVDHGGADAGAPDEVPHRVRSLTELADWVRARANGHG